MNNLIAFFPKVVYYCDCLQEIIDEKCEKPSSLRDICNKIDSSDTDADGMIYYAKCGDDKKHVAFSCAKHLPMEIVIQIHNNNVVEIETETRQNCLSSVKKCLQQNYQMLHYDIFKTS